MLVSCPGCYFNEEAGLHNPIVQSLFIILCHSFPRKIDNSFWGQFWQTARLPVRWGPVRSGRHFPGPSLFTTKKNKRPFVVSHHAVSLCDGIRLLWQVQMLQRIVSGIRWSQTYRTWDFLFKSSRNWQGEGRWWWWWLGVFFVTIHHGSIILSRSLQKSQCSDDRQVHNWILNHTSSDCIFIPTSWHEIIAISYTE